MSEKLASLKQKGGGNLTETTLWTNSSPTSGFNASNVTLSDSTNNYKYIKIYWRTSTSNSTIGSIIIDKDTWDTMTEASNHPKAGIAAYTNSATHNRIIFKVSATEIRVGLCYQVGASTYSANNVIPTKICGLK